MGNILIENGKAVGVISKLPESVSVTADGVKTFSQIYDALFALADTSKINEHSKLVASTGNQKTYYNIGYNDNSTIVFVNVSAGASGNITQATVLSSGSKHRNTTWTSGSAPVVTDNSSQVPTSGTVFTIYY